MDLLVAEPLEPAALKWLGERHTVEYAPELPADPHALRQSLLSARAVLLPTSVRVDELLFAFAPVLRAVARLGAGTENLNVEACNRARIEVVRGTGATAAAEAEFLLGAMLALRRGFDPHLPRPSAPREIAGATIGLIGLVPAARSLSAMLSGFGSRLIGYDPSMHASDPLWGRWRVEPLSLRDLLQSADVLCMQLPYYSRYRGLLSERHLAECKPQQLILSTSHAALFDLDALAHALRSGRVATAWLDSIDLALFEPGRVLYEVPNLVTTPRIAGRTIEARERAVWAVAQRLDEILSSASVPSREPRGGGPVSGPSPFDSPGSAEASPLPVPETTDLSEAAAAPAQVGEAGDELDHEADHAAPGEATDAEPLAAHREAQVEEPTEVPTPWPAEAQAEAPPDFADTEPPDLSDEAIAEPSTAAVTEPHAAEAETEAAQQATAETAGPASDPASR